MLRKWMMTVCLLLCIGMTYAQIGGDNTYEFLTLSPSARTTALGGNLITVLDDDLTLAYQNPALLNSDMHRQVALNQSVHFAGISHGYLAYGHHFEKQGFTAHGGVQYIHYGQFQAANVQGVQQGTFRASEYALNVGASYQTGERLRFGANIRSIFSYLESYSSTGLAADVAANYLDTAKRFSFSIVFRNAGSQLSTYNRDKNFEALPFDLQIGFSKQLRYLPFRFSVIGHNLHRWNIRYDDPDLEEETLLFSNTPEPEAEPGTTFGDEVDNFFRHLIFNGELLFGEREGFVLRFGYNHLRRAELSARNLRSLAGLSAGFGMKIKRFRLNYGFGSYHIAGAAHHFGLSFQW